ncbi:hypothetical protein HG536_0D01790 [Torulaspora globosa]|uniref:Pre-mRNA-splicing factor CEF1 n=1 Tax=Torulaspora globosa TaxID=48254 RepID=A0A7G3ZGM1_9SACH|nr:uncharacterized protein HG536_0D01790 [Torulaspora globosa]QLL32657.1 hypothetical protein HG536_0D01790 [Torulaspora globosa]
MAPIPLYVKGGVWSNLEDQIVKAAIQKYGTHQWSKVASLLHKKTAKQCETRWNEYLNPKLNFSEFTREEDARLLDLAGRLPNQWRSIADAMGRTAQVCIERYNKLLAEDEQDSELNLGSSLEFNVGDLNPKSDTIAAKPDGNELGDDEREMLAEARARLLNTQGKKATRKVRERMLEESKRIAQLQKRRELKQAGVRTAIKLPKKRFATELDYNQDVIYEQAPLPGVYDTSQEDARLAKEFQEFEKKVERRGLNKDQTSSGHLPRSAKDNRPDVGLGQVNKGNFGPKTLTDEYKKPALSLPKPGSRAAVSEEDIQLKRRKILANHLDEPLLKIEGDQNIPTQLETKEPLSERMDKKAYLRSLFAALPEAKNDFEVVLESEEEEVADDDDETAAPSTGKESASQSPSLSGKTVESLELPNERIPLKLQSLNEARLPTPPFRENPKDDFELTFNELVATSLMKEDYQQPKDYQAYLHEVENEMKHVQIAGTGQSSEQWQPPALDELLESIRSRHHDICELQKQMSYIEPIASQNDQISRNICGEQLARVRTLQHRYYVNYKMYQDEVKGIHARRQRLEADIEQTKKTAQLH